MDNPTYWKPLIDDKTGKPKNYVSWDNPERRLERLNHSISYLTDLQTRLKNGFNDQS